MVLRLRDSAILALGTLFLATVAFADSYGSADQTYPNAATQAESRPEEGTVLGPRARQEPSDEPALQPKVQNGVQYLSGGVSRNEAEAIAAMGRSFDLKLTMAHSNGAYTGGEHVRIDDSQGRALVDAQSDGPLFFANLAPGSYTVRVSGEGQRFAKPVEIKGTTQQQLSFTWPAEPQSEPGHGEAGDAPRY